MNRLIQTIYHILFLTIRFLINWLMPVFRQLIAFSFHASLYAMGAVWVGWGPATDRIANEWMRRWVLMIGITPLDQFVNLGARIVAFGMILFGWVILAHLTFWFIWGIALPY